MNSRRAYLGSDSVYYAENSAGFVYPTTVYSPLKEGFVRKVADTVVAVEAFWKKMDEQEKRNAAVMNERLYQQRLGRLGVMRDNLNQRMLAADAGNAERDFIKACLRVLDRKEQILQTNSVYGVAAMQEKEAPLAPARKVDDGA